MAAAVAAAVVAGFEKRNVEITSTSLSRTPSRTPAVGSTRGLRGRLSHLVDAACHGHTLSQLLTRSLEVLLIGEWSGQLFMPCAARSRQRSSQRKLGNA